MSKIIIFAKKILFAQFVKNLCLFIWAYLIYLRTGVTRPYGYISIRTLHFCTHGRFNRVFSWLQKSFVPAKNAYLGKPEGLFGILIGPSVRIIADELTDRGYHVFKERIPNDMCDELMRFSLENQLIPRVANSPHMFYDRANPIATVYDTPNQSAIFGSLAFQRLISDPSLLAVVEAYLGPHFYLQNASMRWSNARKKNVSLSDAAQLYHADIDTINWVKIFVYLTDVNVDTGPFCFISGSHRNKPKPVRRDGRLRDEELSAVYKPSDFIEVVGKRGTTIVADTIGFHKGKPLTQDDRLMMYLTFGTSFFGFGMPAKIEATDHISPEFLQKVNELSPLYKGYFP